MKKSKPHKKSDVSFWKVLWFIIKISLISFGGGNAVFPIIRNEVVKKHKWISEEQLDEIIIITNALPGASVPEAIAYIGITTLGKPKGLLVTFLGLLPHIFIFFGLFILGVEFIPTHYLNIIYVGVMPIIIAMLITLVIRYFKISNKELSYPVFLALLILTICFNIFIPSPWNIPAFVIVFVILAGASYELYRKYQFKHATPIEEPLPINGIDLKNKQYKHILKQNLKNKPELYNFLLEIFPSISMNDLNVKYKPKWSNQKGLYLVACKKYRFEKVIGND